VKRAPRPPRGVPRDEWIVALGLAADGIAPVERETCDARFPSAIDAVRLVRSRVSTFGSLYHGAFDARYGYEGFGRTTSIADYAAGAGLMMALDLDGAA
jgi:hypothetical protein